MTQFENSLITYYEIQDGEHFCIQQHEGIEEDSYVTDCIMMKRQIAIDLAFVILDSLDPIEID